ncbi:MAG: WecB/TagA/CpsF family glycosyltransferase [Candidatus Peregrinibacteria bacterium]|nr:WecB/TagA/CpsF family glycosyltransferase [Candidatus Peregrinibacteria bacterium]
MNKKVSIAGINFDPVRYREVITAIEVFAEQRHKKHFIVTPNPEMLVGASQDEEFRKVLQSANMAVADGIGILWAAYYLSLPTSKSKLLEFFRLLWSLMKVPIRSSSLFKMLPQRVTGADLLFEIVEASQETGWRIYLLGAAPGVAGAAIDRLIKKYPKAIFAGSFAGTPAPSHEDDLVQRINLAEPDILFVAYGNPEQEKWIHRNLPKMETVKVAMGVGGAIDFASGRVKRAPKLLRKLGLEWFWRLVREPRRLKRIFRATIIFPSLIFRLKLKGK